MSVKRKRRLPWAWIVVVFAAAGGGGLWAWQQRVNAANAAKLPQGVQVGKAERGDIDQKITATGVISAQVGARVNIGSQISGRIAVLNADVGSTLTKGQVVAVIDAPDFKAQVDQQRHSVEVAQANLRQAESRLAQAKLSLHLSEEQNQAQIQEAEFALKSAEERLRQAEASAKFQPTQTSTEIARAQAALSTARSQEKQVQQTVNLQLTQAQASIDEIRANVENDLRIAKRQEKLFQQGFASQQDLDNARTAYRLSTARLKNAEANLRVVREKNEADLQTARNQVSQADAALDAAKAGLLQNEVRAAEAGSARENVRQAEATLRLRKSNRTQNEVRQQAVREANSAVAQAKASLKQAQAVLAYQEVQLARTVIRSPITGTVLTISTQQGETVAAGFSTPTLVTAADLNRLEVRAYVDEVDIGQTRIGLPAEIRVESFPDRVFHGRVVKVASASTVKDNVVTYETTVSLTDAAGLLRPDMTTDVTLILGRRADRILVPSEAVHREINRSIAYVLHREKQGKERVETREIKIGIDDGSRTEVISGLKPGEEVVLAGLPRLGVKATDAQDADRNKQ